MQTPPRLHEATGPKTPRIREDLLFLICYKTYEVVFSNFLKQAKRKNWVKDMKKIDLPFGINSGGNDSCP